jgi:hypothetical protein
MPQLFIDRMYEAYDHEALVRGRTARRYPDSPCVLEKVESCAVKEGREIENTRLSGNPGIILTSPMSLEGD